ncbi:MAG TPA: DUF3231 family protein [Symbiobacteriaceae bacterium]|nr:DUF3231 family protein [Symbiobacteriaceae bacterium]
MNILQTIFQSATKPPIALHAGEAFGLWVYCEAVAETRSVCLVLINHTEDRDLREVIEHFVDDVLQPQLRQVKEKMLHEGIELPPVTPDKPRADPQQIPVGARLVDEQIANMLVVKVQGLLLFCHEGLSRSLRNDLSTMYYAFQSHVLAQGATLTALMSQRGWLRRPPFFVGSAQAGQ